MQAFLGVFALLSVALAKTAPVTTSPTSTSTTHKEHSPFSTFTKSLPQEKKKPFMELMKRLRSAKAASVGTKEEKKKATMSLDADIHKLLGAEYKRYRGVQHAQKELHAAKKAANAPPGSSPTKKVISPPPSPASTSPSSTSTKKKSSKLPGTASSKKSKKSTTTQRS